MSTAQTAIKELPEFWKLVIKQTPLVIVLLALNYFQWNHIQKLDAKIETMQQSLNMYMIGEAKK